MCRSGWPWTLYKNLSVSASWVQELNSCFLKHVFIETFRECRPNLAIHVGLYEPTTYSNAHISQKRLTLPSILARKGACSIAITHVQSLFLPENIHCYLSIIIIFVKQKITCIYGLYRRYCIQLNMSPKLKQITFKPRLVFKPLLCPCRTLNCSVYLALGCTYRQAIEGTWRKSLCRAPMGDIYCKSLCFHKLLMHH